MLEDRRANLRLAEEHAEDLDRQRRRLREILEKEDDAVERVRLATELRGLEGAPAWRNQTESELFAENGLVIAFPQIDVHFDPVAPGESARDEG